MLDLFLNMPFWTSSFIIFRSSGSILIVIVGEFIFTPQNLNETSMFKDWDYQSRVQLWKNIKEICI